MKKLLLSQKKKDVEGMFKVLKMSENFYKVQDLILDSLPENCLANGEPFHSFYIDEMEGDDLMKIIEEVCQKFFLISLMSNLQEMSS